MLTKAVAIDYEAEGKLLVSTNSWAMAAPELRTTGSTRNSFGARFCIQDGASTHEICGYSQIHILLCLSFLICIMEQISVCTSQRVRCKGTRRVPGTS